MNRTREQIIHSMCGTWRHDYGLIDEQSKTLLFRSMAQIFDNDIASECMMQSDCDNYEEELEGLRDKIIELELIIKSKDSIIESMAQKNTKDKICGTCFYYSNRGMCTHINSTDMCADRDSTDKCSHIADYKPKENQDVK
jgi:hypothetical protein